MSTGRACIIILILMVPSLALAQNADLILYNGKVVTVDANFTITEAVAVRADKILAVGTNQDILLLADESTQKIDLKRRTVIPGVINVHYHWQQAGRRHYRQQIGAVLLEHEIDWALVKTKDDVYNQIAAIVKEQNFKPGEWIYFLAINWNDGPHKVYYEDLHMRDLDTVAPNNPIIVSQGGGPIIYEGNAQLNGRAWEILWSKWGGFLERYGRYWKDSSGNPTGHVESPASKILEHEYVPRAPAEVLVPILKWEMEEMNALGITTVSTRMGSRDVESLKQLEAAGQMTIRAPYGNEDFFALLDPEATLRRMGNLTGVGSDKLWLNSFTPIVFDGSGVRMATDFPRRAEYGQDHKWFPQGQLFMEPEYRGAKEDYFTRWLLALARSGNRLANNHSAGDRATRQLLDIMEAVNEVEPIQDKGWAIDHCRLMHLEDIPRAAKLGVIWNCGPATMMASAPEIERVYGETVAQINYFPLKSLIDSGASVSLELGGHRNFWEELELPITRNVGGKVYGPQERIDRTAVLRMITIEGARYLLSETKLGSLEPGKKADLVVLDRDYLTIPIEEIAQIQALMTLFDGEIVYLHPLFSQEYQLRPDGALIGTFRELVTR